MRKYKENRKAKSLMKLYGIKAKDVANQADVEQDTVWVVLGGYGTSEKIRKAVARLIRRHDPDIRYEDIWPPEIYALKGRWPAPNGKAA